MRAPPRGPGLHAHAGCRFTPSCGARRVIFGQWPVLAFAPRHPAYSRLGTVLNLDEVRAARIVPPSFIKTEKWVEGRGWTTGRDNYWAMQGNDLAHWTVEVQA